MKGIVDDRLRAGRRVVFLDDPPQRLAAMLRGERNDRRGAAERGRYGRAVEIVGGHHPGRRLLLDMAMAVDGAGQHEATGGVYFARAAREAAPQGGDDPVLDAHIARRRIGGGRHRSVADDEIKIVHRLPLC